MYSEFTVKLINEVKKREILYNNKYDRRPKAEKEKCWEDIADILEVNAEKCKKHWKNIRDRFVKIKHARDKHFMNNGSELTAPGYIYYDMLSFMTEFSVRKVVTSRDSQPVETHEVTPEPLLYSDDVKVVDMTKEFIEEIQKHPMLYDPSAEFRRFSGQASWKSISESLQSKFTPQQLRHYWMILMKQYKLYVENQDSFTEPIKNENIFKMMSFASVHLGYDERSEDQADFYNYYKMEPEENHSSIINVIENEDDQFEEPFINPATLMESQNDDGEPSDISNDYPCDLQPSIKKMKFSSLPASAPSSAKKPKIVKVEGTGLDDFDYFGKKVAMQLRNLAMKNQRLSRKAEIEVLQLLMNFEETADEANNV